MNCIIKQKKKVLLRDITNKFLSTRITKTIKMNYLLKPFTLLIFFVLTLSVIAQNNVIDEVIWIIGDEAILKSDVEGQRIRMQYEGTKIDGDPNCFIPEELAIQKLLLHQAKTDSITASVSSVNSQVEQRINYFISQIGSKEKLEEYFGKNIISLKEEMREMVEQQMIAQQMQEKIIGNIKLTPSEVRNYYTQLPKDQVPVIPAKVEVQIIALEPKIAIEEIESIKTKLREFKERVESGSINFSTLAILYSEDTESAKRGGELGFTGRGMLVPEFATVAFNLNDPKKVSQIVETEYGYHIIQLIEKRGDRINCRHILLKPKVSLIEQTAALAKLDSIANNIRNGKQSFEDAVTQFSSDKKTRMNAGLMANPETGNSKFQYKDLPQEMGKIVNELNAGEISEPFIYTNSSGKQVCAILKVKSKTKTHMANLNDDYQEIKDALLAIKSQEKLDAWIANKQKETYIKIKDGWDNCNFKYPGWVKR